MLQMQRLQPQLKAIQTRHKGDREKMNEELLKFYKANNINPVGGCLPLLIQMPVFFILFQVLRGLTRRVTNVGLQAGLAATAWPGQPSGQSRQSITRLPTQVYLGEIRSFIKTFRAPTG